LLIQDSEAMEMPNGTSDRIMAGDRPVAELVNPATAEVPTQWNSYVTGEDLGASVAKAEELGAAIALWEFA
tara:strand:+ start:727 stop:939 length:213 start_codon:yes stop_codon:yes gene_type:complete